MSFNSDTDWVPNQIKLRFKGTGYLHQYTASLKTFHRPLKYDQGFKYLPSIFVKSHQPDPPSRSWPINIEKYLLR